MSDLGWSLKSWLDWNCGLVVQPTFHHPYGEPSSQTLLKEFYMQMWFYQLHGIIRDFEGLLFSILQFLRVKSHLHDCNDLIPDYWHLISLRTKLIRIILKEQLILPFSGRLSEVVVSLIHWFYFVLEGFPSCSSSIPKLLSSEPLSLIQSRLDVDN